LARENESIKKPGSIASEMRFDHKDLRLISVTGFFLPRESFYR
jgi:hypothetical protein